MNNFKLYFLNVNIRINSAVKIITLGALKHKVHRGEERKGLVWEPDKIYIYHELPSATHTGMVISSG